MKKILLTLFFAAGIFLLWSHGEMVWSNRRFLDEPKLHKIEKGENLSRLAQQYYGNAQRWHELALINRAPNPNHVEVGEEIFVPAANVAAELGRARTLTKVNALVSEQKKLVQEPSQPVTDNAPATTPAPSGEVTTDNGAAEPATAVEETPAPIATESPLINDTSFPWLWVGLGAIVLAIVGIVISRQRQNAASERNVAFKSKESSFDDFRNRRHYAESGSHKTSPFDHKKEETADPKDKDSVNDDFRSRRKYSESITATN